MKRNATKTKHPPATGKCLATAAAPTQLPTIRIKGGDLPHCVDQAEGALIDAALDLYQRGGAIVRPVKIPVAVTADRDASPLRLVAVDVPAMVEAMTIAAKWQQFDNRIRRWVPTNCSRQVAETYLSRKGLWKLPVLAGIVHCPTLRPDGSLLDAPGYDQHTGILFEPQGTVFPEIPEQPTRDDAVAAMADLRKLLDEFDFVAEADLAVALSAILTTVVRRSLSSAPLHAFNASVAGSGKSLLVDIVSMIASGRRAGVLAQGKTEEELEKRLGAALMAGDPLISFDNCERPLAGDLLCQALTQRFLKIRPLGRSTNFEVPSNAALFATGNNLRLAGDMTRRALLCSLDPGVERPELRQFKEDPLAVLDRDRGKYAAAAVTILRAFHIADLPPQAVPLASFAEWSRMVRDALLWLGEADPCATMEQMRAADPKLSALTAVIEQWKLHMSDARVTAREVIEAAAKQVALGPDTPQGGPSEFHDALLAIAGEQGVVNPRRLGKWLQDNHGRIVRGHKVTADGIRSGTKLWRVVKAGSSGSDGEAGDKREGGI